MNPKLSIQLVNQPSLRPGVEQQAWLQGLPGRLTTDIQVYWLGRLAFTLTADTTYKHARPVLKSKDMETAYYTGLYINLGGSRKQGLAHRNIPYAIYRSVLEVELMHQAWVDEVVEILHNPTLHPQSMGCLKRGLDALYRPD